MSEPIWQDGEDGPALEEGSDGNLVLVTPAGERLLLSQVAAEGLARAILDSLGISTSPAPAAEGYLVYFALEYSDERGRRIEIPELGLGDEEGQFTWQEATPEDVAERVRTLGETVARVHQERLDAGAHVDEDGARAFVSVYRLPDDERVWKGYWDEFDVTALLS